MINQNLKLVAELSRAIKEATSIALVDNNRTLFIQVRADLIQHRRANEISHLQFHNLCLEHMRSEIKIDKRAREIEFGDKPHYLVSKTTGGRLYLV